MKFINRALLLMLFPHIITCAAAQPETFSGLLSLPFPGGERFILPYTIPLLNFSDFTLGSFIQKKVLSNSQVA